MYRSPSSPFARGCIALEILLSVGALGGGAALMLGPSGQIIPLPLSALRGSPFDTYFVPGLILFVVLGIGPVLTAVLSWLGHPLAPLASVTVGVALLVWLAAEIAIIGYTNDPPLQPFYIVMGAGITLLGLAWLRSARSTPLGRGPVGA
jgi:hypothetical protein